MENSKKIIKWLFGGLGAAIVATLLAWYLSTLHKDTPILKKTVESSTNSEVIGNSGNSVSGNTVNGDLIINQNNDKNSIKDTIPLDNFRLICFSGRVYDDDTKSPLSEVFVEIYDVKVTSKNDGSFELNLKTKRKENIAAELKFYKYGYNEISKLVYLNDNRGFKVNLKRAK